LLPAYGVARESDEVAFLGSVNSTFNFSL